MCMSNNISDHETRNVAAFMGFRNPGVSIYHPLRSSLDGNSLRRSRAPWTEVESPRGQQFPARSTPVIGS